MRYAVRCGVSARGSVLLLVPALLALGAIAGPAQAALGPADDARIGALDYVLRTAQRLEERDIASITDRRVARGDVGSCRRVRLRLYQCPATYQLRVYRGGAPSDRSTCTQTVRVRLSSIERGRTSARASSPLRCAEDSTAAAQGIPDPRDG